MITYNLFPIPITVQQLEPPSNEILDFVKNLEYVPWHSEENYFLTIFKNRQVLDQFEILKPLKDKIMQGVEKYWREVIEVDDGIDLKIRHSWFTKHKHGELNPAHTHTTSLFTLCYYLQAEEKCGDIVFKKDINYLNLFPSMIDLDYKSKNLINSKSFSITPKPGMMVCFPSHLNHETEPNLSGVERYALNMDFWFTGKTRKNSNGFESVF